MSPCVMHIAKLDFLPMHAAGVNLEVSWRRGVLDIHGMSEVYKELGRKDFVTAACRCLQW